MFFRFCWLCIIILSFVFERQSLNPSTNFEFSMSNNNSPPSKIYPELFNSSDIPSTSSGSRNSASSLGMSIAYVTRVLDIISEKVHTQFIYYWLCAEKPIHYLEISLKPSYCCFLKLIEIFKVIVCILKTLDYFEISTK